MARHLRQPLPPLPPTLSIAPEDSESAWPLSEYMVPAQDSHGHSAKVVIRLPPGLKRQMSIIVSRRVFPFETDTDIARWCLFVGIKALKLRMRDPEVSSLHSMTETWKIDAQYNLEHAHFEDILTHLRSTIDSLLARKAMRQARKMVKDIQEGLGELDAYWKRKYEADIIDRYAFLGASATAEALHDRSKRHTEDRHQGKKHRGGKGLRRQNDNRGHKG